MKALLYKDSCLIARQMRLFLLLAIPLFFSSWSLSFQTVTLCLLPLLGLPLPVLLASYDEHSKWNQYTKMLPYSPRELVLSRCVVCWLFTSLMAVLSLLSCALFSPGHQITPASLLALAWLTAGIWVAQAILLPVLFRMGVIHGQVISMAVLLAGFIVVLNILWGINANNPWSELPGFMIALAPHAPVALLLAVAANGVSVPASMKQYVYRMG